MNEKPSNQQPENRTSPPPNFYGGDPEARAPYGANPYDTNPYGVAAQGGSGPGGSGQNPAGGAGPGQNPPGQNPPGQNPPGAYPPGPGPAGPNDTSVLGQPWGGAAPPPGTTPPAGPRGGDDGRRRRTLGAGVVVGSLVLGALAGFGGAAAYDAINDDSPSGGTRVIDQGRSTAGDGSVEKVAKEVLPSVVRIDVTTGSGSGSGSGIVLSEDGRILTNNHVVENATNDTVTVSFNDGKRAEAKVLGTDPLTDTAVIQAEGVDNLQPATIGKSSNLQVGQEVVAIGSPFGLDATVTSGIVSALDRPVNAGSTGQGQSTTYPAIQTDAAINPGNSGGPLVDLSGAVVGINSSIRTAASSSSEAGSIGLGFAIPIDEVMPIVEQMSKGETPTHARLGITVSDSESDIIGALVREVSNDSAAQEAGLEPGDVITKIQDDTIDGADDLVATVRSYRPGDEVKVTYERDGKERTVELKLDSDEGTPQTNQDGSQGGNDNQGENRGNPGNGNRGGFPWGP